ncbi:hypothetical protein [Hymenobacter ruricola]|uniref:Uncharacterized protein n=1 Tax=Hymenobacter ruricola TaxID=2791023 RepID=A0ABS0I0H6_9BACT|nr:hypothetical protein [Hymenobacter ruricola]MBF9220441.1 hypothetical protein [Hymenobacter ruricola]
MKAAGFTKKYWQGWFIGFLMGSITVLAINPTQAQETYRLVKAAFGGLFLHKRASMKPYDKTPLHKLIGSADTELMKLKKETNTYRNVETSKLTTWCSGLEKWVKNYPLAKGASYQKSIQGILAKLTPKQAHYSSSLSAADYLKTVQQFRTLAQKIDKENRTVFIVHGRDHVTRNEVQQALHSLSIPSIV